MQVALQSARPRNQSFGHKRLQSLLGEQTRCAWKQVCGIQLRELAQLKFFLVWRSVPSRRTGSLCGSSTVAAVASKPYMIFGLMGDVFERSMSPSRVLQRTPVSSLEHNESLDLKEDANLVLARSCSSRVPGATAAIFSAGGQWSPEMKK